MNDLSELVRRTRAAGLDGLLIGGNALRLLGYLRNTVGMDFLKGNESPRLP